MSRKNKLTEEVVTDPERIAYLARRCREHGDVDTAEMLEVATEIRLRKKRDRIIQIEITRRREARLQQGHQYRSGGDHQVGPDGEGLHPRSQEQQVDHHRSQDDCGFGSIGPHGNDIFRFTFADGTKWNVPADRVRLAKMLEAATEVEIWIGKDGGFHIATDTDIDGTHGDDEKSA